MRSFNSLLHNKLRKSLFHKKSCTLIGESFLEQNSAYGTVSRKIFRRISCYDVFTRIVMVKYFGGVDLPFLLLAWPYPLVPAHSKKSSIGYYVLLHSMASLFFESQSYSIQRKLFLCLFIEKGKLVSFYISGLFSKTLCKGGTKY